MVVSMLQMGILQERELSTAVLAMKNLVGKFSASQIQCLWNETANLIICNVAVFVLSNQYAL